MNVQLSCIALLALLAATLAIAQETCGSDLDTAINHSDKYILAPRLTMTR